MSTHNVNPDQPLNGTRIHFDIRNSPVQADSSGRLKLTLRRKECVAAIVHPSLGAPLLVEKGEPLSFFIITDDSFHELYRRSPGEGNDGGPEVRLIIARYAKLQTFPDAVADKTKLTADDKPLYGTDKQKALDNIRCRYLGDVGETGGMLSSYGDNTFIGRLNPQAIRFYGDVPLSVKADKPDGTRHTGLHHLFEITLSNLDPELEEKTLYNLSWIGYDPYINLHGKPYLERKDQYAREFLKNDEYIPDTLDYAYEVSGKSATFEHDQSRPLQNFHPVWVAPAGKEALNIGHLTDVHVSARQHAFRISKAKLIPGTSPEIGPLVNASYDNLKDLMDQFGKDGDIDLLIFTGDLIDYGRNYNPKKFIENKDCTGKLWQEMNLNHLDQCDANGNPLAQDGVYEPDTERYPRSIDNVMVYSLLVDYMVQNKKPVLLTAGNHEAYTMPYGISPRITFASAGKDNQPHKQESQEKIVGQSAQDAAATQDKRDTLGVNYYDKRANAGIPADHNLTIPEATLMYGPDYARVIMGGAYRASGIKNFNPDNLNWFYTLLTPLSDYVISYGQQCFIVLGWGNDENFTGSSVTDGQADGIIGGFLSRAPEPLTDAQKNLVINATGLGKPCTILCTHFTLANFAPGKAIGTEGDINFNDRLRQYGAQDTGTFENNRYFLYKQVADNRIHYTLSGHTHRAGLYQITNVDDGMIRSNLTVRGNAPTKGDAEGNGRSYSLPSDATPILVSASGGPIPCQNYQGELLGWGLDTPSGSYMHFSGSRASEVGLKSSRIKQARPRLAVALDYADIVGNDDLGKGVFTRFESATPGGLSVLRSILT